jgi:hypothetical protein
MVPFEIRPFCPRKSVENIVKILTNSEKNFDPTNVNFRRFKNYVKSNTKNIAQMVEILPNLVALPET